MPLTEGEFHDADATARSQPEKMRPAMLRGRHEYLGTKGRL